MSEFPHESPSPAADEIPATRHSIAKLVDEWLLISVVSLTVLSLAAAHAPAAIRLLGLFGIGFGLLAGYGIGRLAAALRKSLTVVYMLLTFLLIAAAGCGVVWESRRIYAADLLKSYGRMPLRDESRGRPGAMDVGETRFLYSATDAMREARRRHWEEQTTWTAYLQWRMSNSPFNELSAAWAVAITIAEWMSGAAIGTWMFAREVRNEISTRPSGESANG